MCLQQCRRRARRAREYEEQERQDDLATLLLINASSAQSPISFMHAMVRGARRFGITLQQTARRDPPQVRIARRVCCSASRTGARRCITR